MSQLPRPIKQVETNCYKKVSRKSPNVEPIFIVVTSGVEIEYSIHEMLGSYKMGTTALNSKKFIEMNLQYKDSLGNGKNFDFVVAED